MATSIMILVSSASFDTTLGKYNASWVSVDDDGALDRGDTVFGIAEAVSVVNLRIVADAKASHNAAYGTSFNVATPAVLFGGAGA